MIRLRNVANIFSKDGPSNWSCVSLQAIETDTRTVSADVLEWQLAVGIDHDREETLLVSIANDLFDACSAARQKSGMRAMQIQDTATFADNIESIGSVIGDSSTVDPPRLQPGNADIAGCTGGKYQPANQRDGPIDMIMAKYIFEYHAKGLDGSTPFA